jgi:glutamate racemase
LIQEFAGDCRVIAVGSSELVQQAERKLRGEVLDRQIVKQVLDQVFAVEGGDKVDTVVLACTHFPLLKDELVAAAPRPVAWIDSGTAIAKRVAYWIDQHQLSLIGNPKFQSIFTSHQGQSPTLAEAIKRILPGPIETITVV